MKSVRQVQCTSYSCGSPRQCATRELFWWTNTPREDGVGGMKGKLERNRTQNTAVNSIARESPARSVLSQVGNYYYYPSRACDDNWRPCPLPLAVIVLSSPAAAPLAEDIFPISTAVLQRALYSSWTTPSRTVTLRVHGFFLTFWPWSQ